MRNILFEGIFKAANMVIPFIMRSFILNYLGMQYLGLNGLFRSILTFLNLAELGVGSAMVFSMYKPIAEDDTDSICALIRLYKIFYRIIGLFIAVVGLALVPFLRTLVKDDIPPDMNLYILYYMNLGNTVLTYWLFAYKGSLLQAHQRRDVISKVSLAVHLTEYALKILVLVLFRNYYIYLTIQLVAQIMINLLVAWRTSKMYPLYTPRGKLPKEKVRDIVRRVRDMFTSKFSYVILNSADTLVISSFMGLTALAIYQNYYYIITSIRTFLDVIAAACIAGVGNSLVTESDDKNYRDLEKFSLLFNWLLAVTTAMLLCMFQPFMFLWMGEENMLAFNYVICFAVYYYSIGVNRMVNMFKDAAGIWRKDRWRPLVGAIVNLALNLATVQWLGLYGVLLSSVFSILVVQMPWLFHNLFSEVFPRNYMRQYVRFFIVLTLLVLVSSAASWYVCSLIHLDQWASLFVYACISFVIPNVVFFAVYGRSRVFKDSVAQIKRVVLKKLPKKA